jgi:hypothetical protein
METADILKLLTSGGVAGALLVLIYLVGNRMVAAIDRVATKLDEHTKVDIASHAEVRDELIEVKTMLTTERRLTPVEGVPISGPGMYGPRPGTRDR